MLFYVVESISSVLFFQLMRIWLPNHLKDEIKTGNPSFPLHASIKIYMLCKLKLQSAKIFLCNHNWYFLVCRTVRMKAANDLIIQIGDSICQLHKVQWHAFSNQMDLIDLSDFALCAIKVNHSSLGGNLFEYLH